VHKRQGSSILKGQVVPAVLAVPAAAAEHPHVPSTPGRRGWGSTAGSAEPAKHKKAIILLSARHHCQCWACCCDIVHVLCCCTAACITRHHVARCWSACTRMLHTRPAALSGKAFSPEPARKHTASCTPGRSSAHTCPLQMRRMPSAAAALQPPCCSADGSKSKWHSRCTAHP
jgi:hypothetical protein